LPPENALEVFRQWAMNSLRGYADRVAVARLNGAIVGYCTWRIHKTAHIHTGLRLANLDLTAVLPEARFQYVLTSLVEDGLAWLGAQGVAYGEVYTHALNAGMQRACAFLGATTLSARHGLHWHREY
jgi:hypothetical protein